MKLINYVSVFIGCIGAFISSALGGWDMSIETLLIFMITDYVLGVMCAGIFKKSKKTKTGALSSKECYKGILKKIITLILVIIAVRIDLLIPAETNFCRDGVVIALICNELISIVENLGIIGIPIPKVIMNAIDILKRKEEEND